MADQGRPEIQKGVVFADNVRPADDPKPSTSGGLRRTKRLPLLTPIPGVRAVTRRSLRAIASPDLTLSDSAPEEDAELEVVYEGPRTRRVKQQDYAMDPRPNLPPDDYLPYGGKDLLTQPSMPPLPERIEVIATGDRERFGFKLIAGVVLGIVSILSGVALGVNGSFLGLISLLNSLLCCGLAVTLLLMKESHDAAEEMLITVVTRANVLSSAVNPLVTQTNNLMLTANSMTIGQRLFGRKTREAILRLSGGLPQPHEDDYSFDTYA